MIRREVPIRSMADGTTSTLSLFHFPGKVPEAPSVYIQSGIHASEVQGYAVSLLLIEYFSKYPPLGEITLVPLANPYATNLKMSSYTFGRFDPVMGENWNRQYLDLCSVTEDFFKVHTQESIATLVPMFKAWLLQALSDAKQQPTNYARMLALELQQLALSADIVLDLHCDTHSVPHVYTPVYASRSAQTLGISFIIELSNLFEGALDEAIFCPWMTFTEKYQALHPDESVHPPVEAFTIELGSEEQVNLQEARKQCVGIIRYLSQRGVCQNVVTSLDVPLFFYRCKKEDFVTLYAPTGGIITDKTKLGVPTKAHTSLMRLSRPSLFGTVSEYKDLLNTSTQAITLEEDSIPITVLPSATVHQGMPLMKSMVKYQKV